MRTRGPDWLLLIERLEMARDYLLVNVCEWRLPRRDLRTVHTGPFPAKWFQVITSSFDIANPEPGVGREHGRGVLLSTR